MNTMREALSSAMHEAMSADANTIMIGEALNTRGGAAQLTYGFADAYGPERSIEIPISENALVGMALGAAVAGLKVIAEVYSADFLPCAGSEVVNDIAKWRYQHRWTEPLHLVLRMPAGTAHGWGGPEHSQAIEPLFHNVPGLRIVAPSTPASARASLLASLRCGDPTLLLEHRSLYGIDRADEVQLDDSILNGRITRHGRDLTIVAWSRAHRVVEDAAEELARLGVNAEVIDPVSVKPLPMDLIRQSVEQTNALLVVEDAPRTGSVSAEIITDISTSGSSARCARVTMPDVHHAFDPNIDRQLMPSVDDVVLAARTLLRQQELTTHGGSR